METVATSSRTTIGLIKTDDELKAALEEFGVLMHLDRGRTPQQEDMYELLALVIEHYESRRYPRRTPDPISMIEFEMDQRNLRQRDLVPYIGSRSRVSEILNRKRKLTLKMMRTLHAELAIPLEILIQDYPLAE